MTCGVSDSSGAERNPTSSGVPTWRPSLSATGAARPLAAGSIIRLARRDRTGRRLLVTRVKTQLRLGGRLHRHAIFLARLVGPLAHGVLRGLVEHAAGLRFEHL